MASEATGGEGRPLDIVFVTESLSGNSLGRTYCLWELARMSGFHAIVVSPEGEHIWAPLKDTAFASSVLRLGRNCPTEPWDLPTPDLIVAVKPFPNSFGLARRWAAKSGAPLLLDIDDPDLEATLSIGQPAKRLAKAILRPRRTFAAEKLRRAVRGTETIVSNPVLQARYGGATIPHTRADEGPGAAHLLRTPSVAFVGTNRAHKGTEYLRSAIRDCQDLGYRLVITDIPPNDAEPWENWVGSTSLSDGLRLVSQSDVVVLPSLDTPFARGQLPVKLIDAMILGRAIAVSEIEPMPWALGDGGMFFRPGSAAAIGEVLRLYADPQVREQYGNRARERALRMFTSEANLDEFRRACFRALK